MKYSCSGPTDGQTRFTVLLSEEVEDSLSPAFIDGLHGAEKRGLFIERFASVGTEGGWDTECYASCVFL